MTAYRPHIIIIYVLLLGVIILRYVIDLMFLRKVLWLRVRRWERGNESFVSSVYLGGPNCCWYLASWTGFTWKWQRESCIRIRCSFVSLLTCVPRSTRDSYCDNSRLLVDFLFFAYHVDVDITMISLECRHALFPSWVGCWEWDWFFRTDAASSLALAVLWGSGSSHCWVTVNWQRRLLQQLSIMMSA